MLAGGGVVFLRNKIAVMIIMIVTLAYKRIALQDKIRHQYK